MRPPLPPVRLEGEYSAVLVSRMALAHHAAKAAVQNGDDPVEASRRVLQAAPMPVVRLQRLAMQVDAFAGRQFALALTGTPPAIGTARQDEGPRRSRRGLPPDQVRALREFAARREQRIAEAEIARFVRQNVELIQGLQDRWYDDVTRVVLQSQREGWTATQLERAIAREAGVSRRRAQLIGQDQIGKLNAKLAEQRQVAAGITTYRWSTSRDERVRPSHRRLEGTTHRWDAPPVTDGGQRNHPGQAVRCRCVAVPVLAGLE